MYSFAIQNAIGKGFPDGNDSRSLALLQQHLGLPNQLSSGGVAALFAAHGISASELMKAPSIQDRERILSEELLKHHHQQLGHREQAATIALASRNDAFANHHQDNQESLVLKSAISRLTSMSSHPMAHTKDSTSVIDHNSRPDSSLYCAEQDLSPDKDICFGRGQRVQRRKANVAFRKIVATYQETYDQAVSREDKKSVVKKVARIFSRTGYRFFKESEDAPLFGNGSKMWVGVSDHHVEYKIGHSFRSGRKQLKQKKMQAKEKEESDANVNCEEANTKKSRSQSIVAKKADNNGVFKEDELSDKCICIGDKREKYTGMEAYQYFREFILTFKSIFGMTESFVEKTNIVKGLIEQIKTKKGYRFLKLMSLKKNVEFWVEASAEEISCEVFSILGNPLKPNGGVNKVIDDQSTGLKSSLTKEMLPAVTGTKLKRSSSDEGPLKKRQCLLQDKTSEENCSQPTAMKRVVSDAETNSSDSMVESKALNIFNKSEVISSSLSSSAKVEEKGSPKIVWKKGRKRVLPGGSKHFVPSEIVCKADINKMLGKGKSTISKVENEMLSAISSKGMSIPSSLTSPSGFLGTLTLGNRSPGALERTLEKLRGTQPLSSLSSRQKVLQGNPLPTLEWAGRSTLEKALLAMRPSIHRSREQPMVADANLEAAKQIEIEGKLLQHLRHQELLYMEKKHKLAMLDIQLRSRSKSI